MNGESERETERPSLVTYVMIRYFYEATLQVSNSLAARSAAIAIRIHTEKREIHVIDNGIGIREDALEDIAQYDVEIESEERQTSDPTATSSNRILTNIRRLSDTLTVTSRHRYSTETFMKVRFTVVGEDSKENVTCCERLPICKE